MDGNRKILVCITPQSNSTRLIDRGLEEAKRVNGELHILHVEKGCSVFNTEDTPRLLQSLFCYASERNGVVHGLCGEDVQAVVTKFITEQQMTDVVFGAPLSGVYENLSGMFAYIQERLPQVNIIILERAETLLT